MAVVGKESGLGTVGRLQGSAAAPRRDNERSEHRQTDKQSRLDDVHTTENYTTRDLNN